MQHVYDDSKVKSLPSFIADITKIQYFIKLYENIYKFLEFNLFLLYWLTCQSIIHGEQKSRFVSSSSNISKNSNKNFWIHIKFVRISLVLFRVFLYDTSTFPQLIKKRKIRIGWSYFNTILNFILTLRGISSNLYLTYPNIKKA